MKKCVLLALCTVALSSGAANWYYGTAFELPYNVAETNFISQYDTAGLELATNTTPRQYWDLPSYEDGLLLKRDGLYYDNNHADPFAFSFDYYTLICNLSTQQSITRYLTPDHRKIKIPDGESIYFDALVRFTPSDEIIEPEQALKGGKIALWLYEHETDGGGKKYQLMITGGYIIKGHDGVATVSKPKNYRAWNDSISWDTNHLYRVTIKCINSIVKEERIPGFIVVIDGRDFLNGDIRDFGLQDYTLSDQLYYGCESMVPSAVIGDNSTIESVRFEGDGSIDEILISNTTDRNYLMGSGVENLVVFRLSPSVESLTYTYDGVSHTVSNDYYITRKDGAEDSLWFCIDGIKGADGYTDTPIIYGEEAFTKERRKGKFWYKTISEGIIYSLSFKAIPGTMKVTDGQGNTTCISNSDEVVEMFVDHGVDTNFYVKIIRDMSDMGFFVVNGVDVILDLNGHSISNRLNTDTVEVEDESSLVITNTANGVGRVSSSSGWGIYCDCPYSSLTLAGGAYDTEFYCTTEGEYTGFKITSAECKFKRDRLDESMLTALRQALVNGMGSGYEFQDGTGADEGWLVIRRKAATP